MVRSLYFLLALLLLSATVANAGNTNNIGHCNDDFSGCDWVGYVRAKTMPLIPVALLAIFMGCGCPIFFCVRCCCDGFGGKDPHPGCCYPDKSQPRVYQPPTMRRTKLMVAIPIVLCIIGVILVLTANGRFSRVGKDTINLIDALATEVQTIAAQVTTAINALNAAFASASGIPNLPSNPIPTTTTASFISTVDSYKLTVKNAEGTYEHYDGIRGKATIAVFLLPVIGVTILLLVAVCNGQKVAYCPVALMFCCGSFMFVAALPFIVLSTVTSAVCYQVDLTLQQNGTGIVRSALGCTGSSNPFSAMTAAITDAENQAAEQICTSLNQAGLCTGLNRTLDCPTVPSACNSFTFDLIAGLPTNVAVSLLVPQPSCPPVCNMQKCSAQCTGQLQPTAASLVQLVNGTTTADELIRTTILPLLDCNSLLTKFVGPFQPFCKNLQSAFNNMFLGILLLGLQCLAGVVVGILGVKRFASPPLKAGETLETNPTDPTAIRPTEVAVIGVPLAMGSMYPNPMYPAANGFPNAGYAPIGQPMPAGTSDVAHEVPEATSDLAPPRQKSRRRQVLDESYDEIGPEGEPSGASSTRRSNTPTESVRQDEYFQDETGTAYSVEESSRYPEEYD
eukprot:TRINITY_DN2009_c0_g1_i4.p1 TRINITY_DN2009_c0_g1~~TRINITY_DN2009_c0_g1_i4.p1  ORF type:complete len:638 (-),score=87.70 TRINITY_DN2009_c0_g1_i4:463-2325(-)